MQAVAVHMTVFRCIPVIEDPIGYDSPVDYQSLADYASLVTQKVAVEVMIGLVAGWFGAFVIAEKEVAE